MKNCESYESLVSVWLDDELDRPGQVECLDHLMRCASCRGFYLDARALDGLVGAIRTPTGATEPSPDVWKRIERATRKERARPARRRIPAWALQAAAVIVVGVGLSFMVWSGRMLEAPLPEQAEVMLGEDGGQMTDTRFVELTKEVLRAERHYHSAMLEVMGQVVRDTADTREASEEGLIEASENSEPGEPGPGPGQPA